jgi:hypothetical protein
MARTRGSIKRPNTVDRKIHFYRIIPGTVGVPLSFDDLVHASEEVNGLDWTPDGRYMAVADGNAVSMWCDLSHPQIRLRMGTRRTTGLPDIEASGNLTPLAIRDNEGLSEITHMIIFPDNTVGTEFNFFGPRVQRLKHYLESKTGVGAMKLQMLLQGDVETRLRHFRNISLIHLRYKRTDAQTLADMADGGLAATFRGISGNVPLVEIILRNERYSDVPLAESFFESVRNLVRRPESRQSLDIFQIKGFNEETHKPEVFDLLADALITTRQVVKQGEKRRNISSESMYEAINGSYVELRDTICSATALE